MLSSQRHISTGLAGAVTRIVVFALLSFAANVVAADTDGDGLLDIVDLEGFDPNASGITSFQDLGIEDLDGANALTNLQGLDLSYNQIASVESSDFEGLSNLQMLNLFANQITSIESGDFDGLTSLQDLELGINQITSIERGAFEGLANLQKLGLSTNQITRIDSGVFDGLTNLERLYLSGNQITRIESGDFAGLTNLKQLWLQRNQLTSIESGAFGALTNLTSLDLRHHRLSVLNLAGATFSNLRACVPAFRFGVCGEGITTLVLDDAVLSLSSFNAILAPQPWPIITETITDVSLVGLTFSDEYPSNLSILLGKATLDNVTVDQNLFDMYAEEFRAFDAVEGNIVTVVPEPTSAIILLAGWIGVTMIRKSFKTRRA